MHHVGYGPCCNPSLTDVTHVHSKDSGTGEKGNQWFPQRLQPAPYTCTMTTESGSGSATFLSCVGIILRLRITSMKEFQRLVAYPRAWKHLIHWTKLTTLYWYPKPSFEPLNWSWRETYIAALSFPLSFPLRIDAPSTLAPEGGAFYCNSHCHWTRCQDAAAFRASVCLSKTFGVHTQEHSGVISQVHGTGSTNQSPTTPCNRNVIEVSGHAKLCPS